MGGIQLCIKHQLEFLLTSYNVDLIFQENAPFLLRGSSGQHNTPGLKGLQCQVESTGVPGVGVDSRTPGTNLIEDVIKSLS